MCTASKNPSVAAMTTSDGDRRISSVVVSRAQEATGIRSERSLEAVMSVPKKLRAWSRLSNGRQCEMTCCAGGVVRVDTCRVFGTWQISGS
jgi:hypothetical protein